MENFDWTAFTRKIAVKADVETLYRAWTRASEVEKWFLSNCQYLDAGAPIPKSSPVKKGNAYAWQWFLYDLTEEGEITGANGEDHFQFTFAEVCTVDVYLTQLGDHTVVSLTQSGIPTDELSKERIRLGCDAGWSFFLVNLKSVYEGGLDLRNKIPEYHGMLNC
ncbi:MAG: SRPBCC family protein [Bacteroidota bacterium]